MDMDIVPAPATTPVSDPASGAVVANDGISANPSDAPAPPPSTPAAEPVQDTFDFGPEPVVPAADPSLTYAQQLQALQQQMSALAAQMGKPAPKQPNPTSDQQIDDLLDETPVWAKSMLEEFKQVKSWGENLRRSEEQAQRNATIQGTLAEANNVINEARQQHDFTKGNDDVHNLITSILSERINPLVERNPFNHGITKPQIQTAYAQIARQIHAVASSILSKRQQAAAAQVAANAQTAAVTGGAPAPAASQKRPGFDPLTDDATWDLGGDVDRKLQAAISKVTGL